MSKAKQIKAYLYEMDSTRRELAEMLARISNDRDHSDSYKATARSKAIDEARARLKDIAARAEAALPAWDQLAAKQTAFSYDDPKLIAAVQFIKLNGAALPETAWKSMIADFHNKPAVLFYLAETMDNNGIVDGAITAKETAQQIAFNANLPQRLGDGIYFAAEADPTARVDLSGLMNELDGLDAFEAALEADAEDGSE